MIGRMFAVVVVLTLVLGGTVLAHQLSRPSFTPPNPGGPLTITTPSNLNEACGPAIQGQYFYCQLQATGGVAPYYWKVVPSQTGKVK